MKARYTITVLDFDGRLDEIKTFDLERDFADEYAEYCGCGYDCREWNGHAIVQRVEGA